MGSRKRQRADEVKNLVALSKEQGATVAEVRRAFNMHHGTASAALSHLDGTGEIVRLAEKRARCSVYVIPEHVGDRQRALPRTARPRPVTIEQDVIKDVADRAFADGAVHGREQAMRDAQEVAEAVRDAEWQRGYDDGVEAAKKRPGIAGEAYADGHNAGVIAARAQVVGHAEAMRREILRVPRAKIHHNRCWTEHPECALAAIVRAAGGRPARKGDTPSLAPRARSTTSDMEGSGVRGSLPCRS